MSFFRERKSEFTIGGLGVLLGVAAGVLYCNLSHAYIPGADAACIKKYSLTSRVLDCGDYEESAAKLSAVDNVMAESVKRYVSEGKATRIAVWVRDLRTLQWAGENETDRYTPASLLKLPIMIAYFKIAEVEPSILKGQLTFVPTPEPGDAMQNFKPAHTLVPGTNYSIEELIEHMIVESDNDATDLLLTHMDSHTLNNILVDLGIKIPKDEKTYDFVTVKSYAAIFRTLYNSSYLNRDYSQKALELLSRASFPGIREPLPHSIKVADKFGERTVENMDKSIETRELHDCGIVYKEENPYSICVMTEGKNYDDLLTIIRDLSSVIYARM